jgi:ssDNA-binding Zn-finger/Zn-ribbon topoisomerase 1
VKECPKCKELRDIEEFRDPSLVKGTGRICITCKGLRKETPPKSSDLAAQPAKAKCPKCGASMVLRHGKFGQFYGCSRFPRCRGTRNLIIEKDNNNLPAHNYYSKNDNTLLNKSVSVNVLDVPIKTNTKPESKGQESLYKQDDQIYVEVCINLQSGKYFIVIDEIIGNEALMIIPTGEKKRLKLNLFSKLEEIKLHELLAKKHITEKQLLTFRKYINAYQKGDKLRIH